jgi:hypothetical protein
MFELVNNEIDKFAAMGHGLEAIEDIAKWSLDADKRDSEAIHTIATIADTLRGMFRGKISAQDAEDEISTLRHTLLGIDYKFDGSEP